MFTGERVVPDLTGSIAYEHLHRYALAWRCAHGVDVLDVACGEGYGSFILSSVAKKVFAVDLSPSTIANASRTYSRPNLTYLQGDCTQIPLDDASLDLVVSFETIEHHDQHDQMMREVKRLLRPNGVLIISTPAKGVYPPGNPYHVKELTSEEFKSLMGQYFSNAQFAIQGMTDASVIQFEGGDAPQTIEYFGGDFREVSTRPNPAGPLPFLIAIASDGPLPELPRLSLFESESIPGCRNRKLLSELEAIRSSWSWQITAPIRYMHALAQNLAGGHDKKANGYHDNRKA